MIKTLHLVIHKHHLCYSCVKQLTFLHSYNHNLLYAGWLISSIWDFFGSKVHYKCIIITGLVISHLQHFVEIKSEKHKVSCLCHLPIYALSPPLNNLQSSNIFFTICMLFQDIPCKKVALRIHGAGQLKGNWRKQLCGQMESRIVPYSQELNSIEIPQHFISNTFPNVFGYVFILSQLAQGCWQINSVLLPKGGGPGSRSFTPVERGDRKMGRNCGDSKKTPEENLVFCFCHYQRIMKKIEWNA